MVNELFLAIVYRPKPGSPTGLIARAAIARRSPSLAPGARRCTRCVRETRADIAGVARPTTSRSFSELSRPGYVVLVRARVLGRCSSTANGAALPLPRGPLNDALATTRLFFGTEAIEYRLPTETRVGAMLGIKEYPTPTAVGMYDRLLSAPFPLRADSILYVSLEGGQPGSAAAAVPSHG